MTKPSSSDRTVDHLSRTVRWIQPESLLIAAVVMACVAGLVVATPADPDLWGHVTFGRDIAHQTALTRIPTYSFTADRPWINHEWLSEVLMYAFYAAFGATGLIALKVLVCAAAAILVV